MRDLGHGIGKLSLLLLVDGRCGGKHKSLVGQRGSRSPRSKVGMRRIVLGNVLGLALGEVQGSREGSIQRHERRRRVDRRRVGEVTLKELGLRVVEVEMGGQYHAQILHVVNRRLLGGEGVLSLVLLLAFYRAVERRVKGLLGREGRLESVALSLRVDDRVADGAVVVEAVHGAGCGYRDKEMSRSISV